MRQGILAATLASAAFAAAVLARQPGTGPELQAITERLERAVLDDDTQGIRGSRAELLRILAAGPSPDRARLVRYAIAYAGWRLSTNPAISSAERDDLLDEAEDQLDAAVKLDSKFAEGLALLSGVYGLKIANAPIRGMLLGPRSSSALERAAGLEADNPRVLISQGVSKFNTPAMFGGSLTEAETYLRRAIERLAAQPGDKPFPAWGRFDAHAWLGQILVKQGNKTAAREEYARALEVAPRSGWVRYILLPELDKNEDDRSLRRRIGAP